MLRGLLGLIVFQLLGMTLSLLLIPQIPGPILGLLLLLSTLCVRGRLEGELEKAAQVLLSHLPLLLIPPAVGIMVHFHSIIEHAGAVSASLLGSLLIGIPFTGYLMQLLIKRAQKRRTHP